MPKFDAQNPPSVAEYARAIAATLERSVNAPIIEMEREILRLNYQSPGRSLSRTELSARLGYSKPAASNLSYGGLAKEIALQLGVEQVGKSRTDWWKVLATREASNEGFAWKLRPQVASALEQLGLVDKWKDGNSIPDLDISTDIAAGIEGRLILRTHLSRERNAAIVRAKKASADSLQCEVCGFDSLAMYGEEYCETHHLFAFSEMNASTEVVETSLDDLAIVCANCHRMLHRTNPPRTLDQLRAMIEAQRI
jgi:predicted HNH restriction endonuclease